MKKAGIRVVRDLTFKWYGWYKRKLEEELMQPEPDQEKVAKFKKRIAKLEADIERKKIKQKVILSKEDQDRLDHIRKRVARKQQLSKKDYIFLSKYAGEGVIPNYEN